jgi:hypothetical protein
MKNTTKKPAFIPSGSLPISEFVKQVCRKNDLKQAYLIIRAKVPVSFKQVKRAFNLINNN